MRELSHRQFALAVLAILFVPPFLIVAGLQVLSWLMYRLFPSAGASSTWFRIEWYPIIVFGAHVLISTVLIWFLVRKQALRRRFQFTLTGVAILSAMPFLLLLPSLTASWLLYQLLPSASFQRRLVEFVHSVLVLPGFLSMWLLADVMRYVAVSFVAVALTLAALIWLLAQERRRVWRRKRFYPLLVALAAVIAFPLLVDYQPAIEAAPGVELQMVEQPGLLEGAAKWSQAAAEAGGSCQYKPLGWADSKRLVYRKECGNSPGASLAYDLDSDAIVPFLGDSNTLAHETCDPGQCITPALAETRFFPPLHYLPGHYEDAVVSPDGRWIAFTARHVYGPEDLLIVSR